MHPLQVRRTAARELQVLQALHHTNLVSFLESFRADGKLHLVFEFMDRTLLHDMEEMPHGIPNEAVECNMLQLVHAVQFLHQNKVPPIMVASASAVPACLWHSGSQVVMSELCISADTGAKFNTSRLYRFGVTGITETGAALLVTYCKIALMQHDDPRLSKQEKAKTLCACEESFCAHISCASLASSSWKAKASTQSGLCQH